MKLRRRVLRFWPLPALCVLLSIRWMLADAWPSTPSTLSSEAASAALGTMLCLAFALRQPRDFKATRRLSSAALAGALLFAGLNAGLLARGASPRGTDLLISFALTPVVIALALIAVSETESGLNGVDLAPGILAAAGLLLILPQPLLTSFAADAVLVLAPVLIGASAVWLGPRLDQPLTAARMSAALAGAAVVFGAFALRPPRTAPTLSATALDLLTMLLTLLTLQACGVRRFGAQFAAVPLLLLLEGLLLSRVRPNWEQAGGLLLVLTATVLLLRSPRSAGQERSAPLLT